MPWMYKMTPYLDWVEGTQLFSSLFPSQPCWWHPLSEMTKQMSKSSKLLALETKFLLEHIHSHWWFNRAMMSPAVEGEGLMELSEKVRPLACIQLCSIRILKAHWAREEAGKHVSKYTSLSPGKIRWIQLPFTVHCLRWSLRMVHYSLGAGNPTESCSSEGSNL